jgi:hypothetical protein
MLTLLKEACTAFLANQYSISDFQGAISRAAFAVTSYEDRELRRFLENAEAQVDSIRFMNSESEAAKQIGVIAKEILQVLEGLDGSTWQRML